MLRMAPLQFFGPHPRNLRRQVALLFLLGKAPSEGRPDVAFQCLRSSEASYSWSEYRPARGRNFGNDSEITALAHWCHPRGAFDRPAELAGIATKRSVSRSDSLKKGSRCSFNPTVPLPRANHPAASSLTNYAVCVNTYALCVRPQS